MAGAGGMTGAIEVGRAALGAALCAVLLAVSVPTAAPAAPEMPTLATANGTCNRLVVSGQDQSVRCTGKLLNTIYKTGRVGFYFITDKGAAVTFTGMGSQQVKPDADTAVQPIDGVVYGADGRHDRLRAVGHCRFTNPYARAGTVLCKADTEKGSFEAAFTTNGKPPAMVKP